MLANQGQAAELVTMLAAVSAAATVNATSAWIDVRKYEGDLVIVSNIGIVSAGSITPTIEDATDGSGTGAAAVTPAEGAFTAVTTANDPLHEKRTIPAGSVRGWIRYVGTIVTGPALVGVSLLAHPKYT
ncbi:MAG TPA: hypothetical protein VJT81_06595 [Burkholderiales bacterium]|nr:hypothetical protein [Burkholderiales bacterium]